MLSLRNFRKRLYFWSSSYATVLISVGFQPQVLQHWSGHVQQTFANGKLTASASGISFRRNNMPEFLQPSFEVSDGIVGTKDGQDIQDDYTLAIEKKLWRKSLDSIIRIC